MTRPRVVVVGSLHYDIMVRAPYLPRVGETLIGEAWWWKPGGKGGNQAMAAARHGAAVEMIGCLGADEFGVRLRERLAGAGVGIGGVRSVVEGSGMSVAIEQDGGDYAAVVVSGANRDIDEHQVARSAATIRDGQALLLQNEIGEAANVAAARLARDGGATVILNAAPMRPLEVLAGLVDLLVVNAVEAEMLCDAPVNDLRSASVAARTLAAAVPTAVVTAGAAGLVATSAEATFEVPAHTVTGAGTHGAGDVFAGALAARLASGDPLEPALRYANAAAALHVAGGGAAHHTDGPAHDAGGPADVRAMLARVDAAGAGS